MATPKGYAVILQPTVPKEILALLDGYLHSHLGLVYVVSLTFDESIHFAYLSLRGKDSKTPWKVSIPISCILALAEISRESDRPGFV